MTLGLAERAGVAERAADGDEDGLDDSLEGDSLGLGVLREGSPADSLSEPPHPARTTVNETIRVASRNIRRA
jgi:hypothetical protein